MGLPVRSRLGRLPALPAYLSGTRLCHPASPVSARLCHPASPVSARPRCRRAEGTVPERRATAPGHGPGAPSCAAAQASLIYKVYICVYQYYIQYISVYISDLYSIYHTHWQAPRGPDGAPAAAGPWVGAQQGAGRHSASRRQRASSARDPSGRRPPLACPFGHNSNRQRPWDRNSASPPFVLRCR